MNKPSRSHLRFYSLHEINYQVIVTNTRWLIVWEIGSRKLQGLLQWLHDRQSQVFGHVR